MVLRRGVFRNRCANAVCEWGAASIVRSPTRPQRQHSNYNQPTPPPPRACLEDGAAEPDAARLDALEQEVVRRLDLEEALQWKIMSSFTHNSSSHNNHGMTSRRHLSSQNHETSMKGIVRKTHRYITTIIIVITRSSRHGITDIRLSNHSPPSPLHRKCTAPTMQR